VDQDPQAGSIGEGQFLFIHGESAPEAARPGRRATPAGSGRAGAGTDAPREAGAKERERQRLAEEQLQREAAAREQERASRQVATPLLLAGAVLLAGLLLA